ncbi:unnamed protein product [Parnassius apollo]|uniref:(apollo) hypothetical protein n=1 Tax=Parnassius apollo TaxID=110799 RepID=A0A8S3X4F8_PARAO|nr:unnamed protein product [Parnassius apollo]
MLGHIRAHGECNTNPTARQFQVIYKKFLVKSELRDIDKGNITSLEEISVLKIILPGDDFSDSNITTCDDDDSQIWNPPRFSRRLSTFSYSDLPSLPEIERRRSSRTAPVNVERQQSNVPSTFCTIDALSEQDWVKEKLANMQWDMPSHDDFPAKDNTVPRSDMKDIYVGILANAAPIDYYDLFLTPDILNHITKQTNLYATQCLFSSDSSAESTNHLCTPVTRKEMLKFLALVGWMGLVKLPSIKDYWRIHKLYGIPQGRTVMLRNQAHSKMCPFRQLDASSF